MRVRRLEASDEPQVLSINLSSRPGVAPLDSAELRRLCSVANYHIVAERSPGEIIGYLLAFDNDADYDAVSAGVKLTHLVGIKLTQL